ncbi:MAG: DUF4399 domain-containing protein [Cyanobacteria bacterium P01_A01_bin.40]
MKFKTNFKTIFCAIVCGLMLLFAPAEAIAATPVSHAPIDAQAYIIEPADGATVPETFSVKFGLSGMELAPAGVDRDNTGHHHLLIDQPEISDLTASLPATEQIRHFGKAQTETELTLEPGKHTLQLVLGNYAHVPHDNPVISQPITVEVK